MTDTTAYDINDFKDFVFENEGAENESFSFVYRNSDGIWRKYSGGTYPNYEYIRNFEYREGEFPRTAVEFLRANPLPRTSSSSTESALDASKKRRIQGTRSFFNKRQVFSALGLTSEWRLTELWHIRYTAASQYLERDEPRTTDTDNAHDYLLVREARARGITVESVANLFDREGERQIRGIANFYAEIAAVETAINAATTEAEVSAASITGQAKASEIEYDLENVNLFGIQPEPPAESSDDDDE